MHFVGALCNDGLNACLFAEGNCHNACLKVTCHADNYRVYLCNAKLGNNLGIGHVCALANGEICGGIVDNILVVVNSDNLASVVNKLTCNGSSVSAKAENCVCFIFLHHNIFLLTYAYFFYGFGYQILILALAA